MAPAQQDLLHVLAREHRDHSIVFHELLDRLETVAPRHRRRQYVGLVLNIAVHATAERLIVHPLMVAATRTGEETRRTREREMRSLHERLGDAGAALDAPDRLREALLVASREGAVHADREELEVFVHARHAGEPRELRRLGQLHTTLRPRLTTRYQREGRAPGEPWADEQLHEVIGAWYAESLPGGAPDPTSSLGERRVGAGPGGGEPGGPRSAEATGQRNTTR